MERKKLMILAAVIAACLVVVLGAVGLVHLNHVRVEKALYEKEVTQNSLKGDGVFITLEKDMTSSSIANLLLKNKVIKYKDEFVRRAEAIGLKTGYAAGSYRLVPGISYQEIAKELCRKSKAAIIRFTIPEGYEVRNIVDRLVALKLVDKDKFYEVMNNDNFNYDFLKDLPKRSVRLEGYLFPATYETRADSGEKHIIDMMLKRFDTAFTSQYKQRAKEINMSIDDVVTLASVIERESGNATESPMVSSVFHNRLQKGMKLQSCATVQYILKKRKPVLSTADTKIDSPYNTYQYAGLPIGPIASPGKTSIEAALYPEESDYLYFVLGKNNQTIFSKTYAEHLAAKKGK